jgi:hypothetical protein
LFKDKYLCGKSKTKNKGMIKTESLVLMGKMAHPRAVGGWCLEWWGRSGAEKSPWNFRAVSNASFLKLRAESTSIHFIIFLHTIYVLPICIFVLDI